MLKKAFSTLKAGAGLALPSERASGAGGMGPYFGNLGLNCRDRGIKGTVFCVWESGKKGAARHIMGKVGMNKVVMQNVVEPKEILQVAIDKKIPAIMSYLSKGKWHVAKVLLTHLAAERVDVESTRLEKRQQPINIQVGQPVGISFKYEYGKFVFDTRVVGLEPSPDATNGGAIVLAVPGRIEVIQRRSYFRVEVPELLKVKVLLWHRSSKREPEDQMREAGEDTSRYCQGRLVDISAGGAQVVIDSDAPGGQAEFKKGQFIGMRFTPMPYEKPLMVSAQIRNALPRAGGGSIYLGLQLVGLEASLEGRQVLTRLVGVVERYYKMNQSGTRQRDMQQVPSAV